MKRSAPPRRRTPVRRTSRKRASTVLLDGLWSRVVRQRAGNRCEHCGSTERLCGAHIYPKGAYPALRHDVLNGVCLCWSDHLGPRGAHKNPMRWGGEAGAFAVILETRGQSPAALAFRAQTASRPDKEAIRLALEMELR